MPFLPSKICLSLKKVLVRIFIPNYKSMTYVIRAVQLADVPAMCRSHVRYFPWQQVRSTQTRVCDTVSGLEKVDLESRRTGKRTLA